MNFENKPLRKLMLKQKAVNLALMLILYHLPLSPFCRKIRLVLAEKSLKVELLEEPVWQKRSEFLKLNPASKVPVLVEENLVLTESGAIFEYIEEVNPSPCLLPGSPEDKAEARRLVSWFDDTFHADVTSKLLYERVYKKLAKSGQTDSLKIMEGLKGLKFHIKYLESILGTKPWLAGNQMTIADFAGVAHISTLDYIGVIDWSEVDSLKGWYQKLKSRPAFRSLLLDFLPGFSPPNHYTDLDF